MSIENNIVRKPATPSLFSKWTDIANAKKGRGFLIVSIFALMLCTVFLSPHRAEAGRVWSSGLELGTSTNGVEGAFTGGVKVTSTVVRSGSYAERVNQLVSGTLNVMSLTASSANMNGPFFVRAYFYPVALPTASNTIMTLRNAAGTRMVLIKLDNAGKLILTDEDGQIGSSTALTLNKWYRVEVQYDKTGVGGAHVVRARLDGVEFAGASNRNLSTGINRFYFGGNVASEAQTVGDWYFDDMAINDNTGSNQNSFPGEGKIVHLHPNIGGDNAMGTRGGTDTGSDWGQLAEVAPDSTSTYYILDVNNDIIDVGIQNSAVVGISAIDTISLVQVGIRERAATAAGESWKLRIKSQSGGTDLLSATTTHDDTAWKTNGDVVEHFYKLTSYVDPQAGGAWTTALLDNSQIGVIATDATPDVWVSTLWGLVEYVTPLRLEQVHYRWRYDDDDGTEAANEDTATSSLPKYTTRRLRIEVSNESGRNSSSSPQFRLEYATSTGAAIWTQVGNPSSTSAHWVMKDSPYRTDGQESGNVSTSPSGLTDANPTFVSGTIQDLTSQTVGIQFSETDFTELEFAIAATSTAIDGQTYYFRLTDAGTTTGMIYVRYPQVTLAVAGSPDLTQIHYRWRDEGWYGSSWGYRQKITVQSSKISSTQSNFPVYVNLTDLGSSFWANVKTGCVDIRVTSADGTTELPREVAACNNGSSIGELHFKALSLSSISNTEFYIYYGNAGASDYASSSTYGANNVWDGNYRFVQHQGDLLGTAILDSTPNAKHGVKTSSVSPAATSNGFIDGAQSYAPASSDKYTISDTTDPTAYTISGWVKANSLNAGNGRGIFVRTDSGGPTGAWSHELALSGNGVFEHYAWDGSANDVNGSTVVSTGTWYYVVATGQNSANMRLYVNGAEEGTAEALGTLWTGGDRYYIGSNSGVITGGTPNYWDGTIDEVRLSTSVRSSGWILTEYNNQFSPSTFYTTSTEESSSSGATWAANEDQPLTNLAKATAKRLRFEVSNEGTGASGATQYRLEYATSTGASAWTQAGPGAHWVMVASAGIADGASTTNIAGGLTDEEPTFTSGQEKDAASQTGNITVAANQFTELEYSIAATTTAIDGATYYFRLTNAGAVLNTYTIYASATLATGALSNVTQIHYRWRDDDMNEANATAAANEDTSIIDLAKYTTRRLRLEISNEGTANSSALEYRIEYATSTFGPWTQVGNPSSTSAHWVMWNTVEIADGAPTTNIAASLGLTDENSIFTVGQIKDQGNQTAPIALSTSQFTEIEYSLRATSTATDGQTYYFRLTNAGTAIDTYTIYASATIAAAAADLTQIHYRWRNDDGVEASSSWWNTAWGNRRKIIFDNGSSTEVLTDFSVLVALNETGLSNIDYSKTQNSGQDIRFIDSDDSTALDYEIEKWDESSTSLVWVKIPSLATGTADYIYVYYNNPSATDNQNADGVWSDGYTGVWHLNSTSSNSVVTDSTVGGYHGTASGTTPTSTGRVGDALYFNGTTEKIGMGDPSGLNFGSGVHFTLEMWVRAPSNANPQFYVEKRGANGYQFRNNAGGNLILRIDEGASNIDTGNANIFDDAWHYVAAGRNANMNYFFLDGVLYASTSDSTLADLTDPQKFTLGASDVGGLPLTGTLDEVRVASTSRTVSWITAQYKSMSQTFSTYAFEEASNTSATWAAAEDQSIADVIKQTTKRLRFEISNEGVATSSAVAYRLEYATSSGASTWTQVGTGAGSTAHWVMTNSIYVTDSDLTIDVLDGGSSALTNENTTFESGRIKDTSNQTVGITLSTTQFTELEYSIAATTTAIGGQTYYFRLTNAGTALNTYTIYASATLVAASLTQIHYRWYENRDNITPIIALALQDATATDIANSDVVRLRVGVGVSSTDLLAGEQFKLQFSTSKSGGWADVGAVGSGSIWRGYNNTGVTDGATISSLLTIPSDKAQTYQESNPSASTPNTIYIATSTIGKNWIRATNNPGWTARYGHKSLVYDNKMWVIAGNDGSGNCNGSGTSHCNDVWYSTDGANWIQATSNAAWSARFHPVAVVYNDKMWLMGGDDSSGNCNGSGVSRCRDVWYSTDGANWTQATSSAEWPPRRQGTALVYNNKMWIIAGDNAQNASGSDVIYSDVWYSTDGASWTQATPTGIYRTHHTSVVYNNKMWVMGGFTGTPRKDAWYSTDGITWASATVSAQWSGRITQASVVYDDKMWVMGGINGDGISINDVWYSSDGVTWISSTDSAQWDGRRRQSSVAFNDRMWILGGADGFNADPTCGGGGTVYCPDVWYSEGNSIGEWDWVVQNNGAPSATTYYFRMIKSDGTVLDTYSVYPSVTTLSPSNLTQIHYRWRNDDGGEGAGGSGGGVADSNFGTGGFVIASSTSHVVYAIATDSTYMYLAGNDSSGDWRIEKRLLSTGAGDPAFGTNGVVTGASTSSDARGIAIDSTYMYVVGNDSSGDWRIEKRRLDNGEKDFAFGVNGVVTGSSTSLLPYAMAIDSTYMYVVGADAAFDWRIEKRLLSNGAGDVSFGVNGVVTGSSTSSEGKAIAIDSTYMYVAGDNSSGDWRIEKRYLSNGAGVPAFGTNGVVSGSSTSQSAWGIAVDSTYMYVVGSDLTADWRIEKRRLDNGAGDASFGVIGVVLASSTSQAASAIKIDSTYMYVVGGEASYWRIEKRRLDSGAGDLAFGTNGVVTVASSTGNTANAVAVDSVYMYTAGFYDLALDWRIEKRTLSAGGATWAADEDQPITNVSKQVTKRLRFEVSNEGSATSSAAQFRLEYATSSLASTWTRVGSGGSPHWSMSDSSYFTDGASTTDVASGLTNENTTFEAGQIKDTGSQTAGITLASTEFTELEYSVAATASAINGQTYYFRLTSDGAPEVVALDTYTIYASATIAGSGIAAAASGTLISHIFDTQQFTGSALNSIYWQGFQPADTAVKFQIAAASLSTGPWEYRGPNCTVSADDTYDSLGPNVAVQVNRTCHNNKRYFRYKIILEANAALTASPRVDSIILNWSP